MSGGNFVISLDFELMWGVRDKTTKENYGANILGVHQVIPTLLDIFHKNGIKSTFSIVGFLFFENKIQLLNSIPKQIPSYKNKNLSPYDGYINLIGEDFYSDLYHYAPTLIRLIQKYPDQEIGTHTFSHYYCLEEGQVIEEFKNDIQAAIDVAKAYSISLSSLVFPRNQFNDSYIKICEELGIICYRGNEQSWLYTAKNETDESLFRRACRLLDAYLNLSGHNCYTDKRLNSTFPVNIPSSRFLRPYIPSLKILEPLRYHRIKTGMTYAAKHNLTYHLWWHPHNFGINQKENFLLLEKILNHYKYLQEKYDFQSITMTNLAKKVVHER
ncbi:polysaccharide deacetylase family protein [Larkinella sp. C7]|uniref:polysaccharide deacetylase family protein n=1 Tax=Larkinella sp. C7 TaxID=2576607 RepID=UPI00111117F9|nr:polysaccharide deacetylase family protein [Larkinella sp. C7]